MYSRNYFAILQSYQYTEQVISANTDGPRDAASRANDHLTLHTMTQLDIECIHQATASVSIDSTLLHRPTAISFYNIRAW